MRKLIYLVTLAITLVISCTLLMSNRKEEGMFPLNYLNEKSLKEAGMHLNASDIFNPDGIALTNALVKVGGCTGSFISPEGLIITNHHCVYGGVSDMSSEDHNYLEKGFVAKDKSAEMSINMPCRITKSYEDVSTRVLKGIDDKTEPNVRSAVIRENIRKIIDEEKVKHPDMSNEISEMFVGKSYMLFRYVLITDVRLVFAPPVTIGQFGGDLDNWEWPRHNGDFSMVRAYVGRDGKPAPYSPDNIPYTPEKYLKINAKGSRENDFVFIMGYPGRTFRHESAPYMKFQQEFQLPTTQEWYSWCISEMQKAGQNDVNKSLAFAGEIQSLANVEKNYRGKMQGLLRTGLVQRKYSDEQAMSEYAAANGIDASPILKLRELWKRKTEIAPEIYLFNFLNNHSSLYRAGIAVYNAKMQLQKAETDGDRGNILNQLSAFFLSKYQITDEELELNVLEELVTRLTKINPGLHVTGKMTIPLWMKTLRKKEKLLSALWASEYTAKNVNKMAEYTGPLTRLALATDARAKELFTEWNDLNNRIAALMPAYLDLKQAYKSSTFIPDANATLRLTYGYIKRYSPNDAEIHTPFTTLRGVFEKANSSPDYRLPQVLADNLRVENIPPFFTDPETGDVVVCFLYNLDTTGGNSGSPVLDANGDLIGVNFDRSFTATINDYAWNEKYSRSIGVDIRYVLYVMKYVGKADHLIAELKLDI